MDHIEVLSIQHVLQILTVLVLLKDFINFQHILAADPAIQICDFLQAGNLAMLMLFNGFHKIRRIHKALMGAGVQPCESLTQQLHVQGAVFQIDAVQVGNL